MYDMTLLCDYYEYTMANGYHLAGMGDRILYFDLFFRKVPDQGGFAIAAGLEHAINYIKDMHFSETEIAYLRGKGIFSESYLRTLENYSFSGDIWAVPEGTVVFPGEPLMTVRAPAIEAQILETYLLCCYNHQSLIATKANRIVRSAEHRTVMEFGARRAHGAEAALAGARAAYIGGCHSTSNTLADQLYGIPASGTMAHSWIQVFEDEYTAFRTYADLYPDNCSLLVDTYNVLKSGMPNAIRVFKDCGITKGSVRIDSGDIAYLSVSAREMLDEAGLTDIKIVASNSLDENIIREVIAQGGKVDAFGVGERLITAKSDPVFGCVYKLVAVEDDDGNVLPKIKLSENVSKITTPHFKRVYRIYGKEDRKAEADLICLHDEVIDESKPLELFDPDFTWKRKEMSDYYLRELMVRIFDKGKLVYQMPTTEEIRRYRQEEVDSLWDSVKRFENPHNYYVDLSQALWDEKHRFLEKNR